MAENRWQLYERIVGALQVEEFASIEIGVTLNANIVGKFSRKERQIDCLIDARFDESRSRRILVDAKNYKGKIDINDVEKFHGMMIDCEASYGLLVCPSGWTSGAESRASEFVGLKLLSLKDAEIYFQSSVFENCCACEDGVVMHDGNWGFEIQRLLSLAMTGKCDRCHSFNVWHWDCGEHFAVRDDEKHTCNCGFDWFVIPPDPNALDDPDRMSAFLMMCAWLPNANGVGLAGIALVDRRPG